MTREPELALVFSPEMWVEELHRHCTDHGGARVRQLVLDPQLALDERFDVLIVSHRWPALTAPFVESLHATGRLVLGVFDRTEPAGEEHLIRLRVDATLESDAGPAEFLRVVDHLVGESAGPVVVEIGAADVPVTMDERVGQVVVVSGPSGTGSSEIAIGLVAGTSRATRVLVDADDVAPGAAQRLTLPIEPNLRTAIDAVEFGLGYLEHMLHPCGAFSVLAGLPNVQAWEQVRPGEVVHVLERLRARFDRVVVDVAAPLEVVGATTRDRYGVARALLPEADAIVAVGVGTPVGVTRLLGWLALARPLARETPMHLVINRAPTDAFRRAEIEAEVRRTFPASSLTFIATDRRVERATWDGRVVERSPFVRAIQRLEESMRNRDIEQMTNVGVGA